MEEAAAVKSVDIDLEKRPGIFFIGSSNVGKRTIISREFYRIFIYLFILLF